jgi:hypothetical protein
MGERLSNVARVSGLTLREAEDLLDWLEQHNYQDRALLLEADEWFAVEFRMGIDQNLSMVSPPAAVLALRRSSAG